MRDVHARDVFGHRSDDLHVLEPRAAVFGRDVVAAKIVNDDREKASIAISKFTKQPIELVKATPPNKSEPTLTPEQLAWWIEVMSSQNMLQSKLDTKKLVLN